MDFGILSETVIFIKIVKLMIDEMIILPILLKSLAKINSWRTLCWDIRNI